MQCKQSQLLPAAHAGYPTPLVSPGPGCARTSSLTSLRQTPNARC